MSYLEMWLVSNKMSYKSQTIIYVGFKSIFKRLDNNTILKPKYRLYKYTLKSTVNSQKLISCYMCSNYIYHELL